MLAGWRAVTYNIKSPTIYWSLAELMNHPNSQKFYSKSKTCREGKVPLSFNYLSLGNNSTLLKQIFVALLTISNSYNNILLL